MLRRKAKVHVIATEKQSPLFIQIKDTFGFYKPLSERKYCYSSNHTYIRNIHLISHRRAATNSQAQHTFYFLHFTRVEKVKDGDWVIIDGLYVDKIRSVGTDDYVTTICGRMPKKSQCEKIVASYDPELWHVDRVKNSQAGLPPFTGVPRIHKDFVKAFVKENGFIDEVFLEYEETDPENWVFERSSGYAGYRCSACGTWVYSEQLKECKCTRLRLKKDGTVITHRVKSHHDISLEKLEEFIKENPEEVKEMIKKVEALNIEGPTAHEYFNELLSAPNYWVMVLPIKDFLKRNPSEFIGKLFKNTDGVYTVLKTEEDITKANGYFGAVPQEVYFLSDEEVRNGEYAYYPTLHEVLKFDGGEIYEKGKQFKVIATTDEKMWEIKHMDCNGQGCNKCMVPFAHKIPASFLTDFINAQGIWKVKLEIEKGKYYEYSDGSGGTSGGFNPDKIKVDLSGAVMISKSRNMAREYAIWALGKKIPTDLDGMENFFNRFLNETKFVI